MSRFRQAWWCPVGDLLPPIDTDEQRAALRWSNRQALAERLHWPPGRLQECEQVSADHPQWHVMWWADSTSGPQEWSAWWIGTARIRVSGATLAELLADMAAQEARIRSEEEARRRPFRDIVAETRA